MRCSSLWASFDNRYRSERRKREEKRENGKREGEKKDRAGVIRHPLPFLNRVLLSSLHMGMVVRHILNHAGRTICARSVAHPPAISSKVTTLRYREENISVLSKDKEGKSESRRCIVFIRYPFRLSRSRHSIKR